MRKIYVILAASLCCLAAGAQTPVSEAMPFVQLDFNPASIAMGSTRVPAAAVLGGADFQFAGGVNYQNYMPKLDGTHYIGAGAAGRISGFAASLSFVRGSGEEISGQNFTPSEVLVNLGGAYSIGVISAGVNVKYAKEQLLSNHAHSAVAADFFVAAHAGGFDIAGGVSSIGQKVESESTGDFSLPSAATFSAGYALGDEHRISARLRGDVFFSGSTSAGLGLEYAWMGTAFIRGGYHYGGESPVPSFASAGLGLCYSNFTFDAAYIFASDVLANSFAVSFGVKF